MTDSTRKTVAWTVMAFVVALWVFVVFFFDGILANIARKKLIELVSSATHGEYQLSFNRFTYHGGVIFTTGTDLKRIAYRAGEQGITLRDLDIDSTRLTGISWWEVIFGKPIALSLFETYQPKVYLCSISQGEANWKLLPTYVAPAPSPIQNVSLTFDSVLIPNVLMYGQDRISDRLCGVFTFKLQNFSYDSKSSAPLHLATKHFDLNIPWIQYSDSSGRYFVRSAHTTTVDSLFAIDTFSYASGTTPTAIRGSGVRAAGIGFVRMAMGRGLSIRSLTTRTWAAKVSIKRNTANPPAQHRTLARPACAIGLLPH